MTFGLSAGAIAGLASTGIGLLSSQGGSQQQSTQKVMDPRLDPYIFGGNGQTGLLQYGQQMLDKNMQPGANPGYDMMKNRGMGLLGGSVAGNPFSGGYSGGANFGPQSGMTNGIGAYTPPAPAPAPAPAPQQQGAPTIDEIIAELQRRQQMAAMFDSQGKEGGDSSGGSGY